jgi:hypothetical protein
MSLFWFFFLFRRVLGCFSARGFKNTTSTSQQRSYVDLFYNKKIDPKEMSVSPPNVLIKFLDVSLVRGEKNRKTHFFNPGTLLAPRGTNQPRRSPSFFGEYPLIEMQTAVAAGGGHLMRSGQGQGL